MAILWILINVMCTVNIRGHEANFHEAEAEIEAEDRKSEAEWFGLEALTSLKNCTVTSAVKLLQNTQSNVKSTWWTLDMAEYYKYDLVCGYNDCTCQ